VSKTKDTQSSNLHIRTNRPAIRLRLGKELTINKKVLYTLNNPKHIQFWWSESEKVLLIGGVTEKTPLSFKINDCYYSTKNGLRFEKRQLIQTIMNVADWRSDTVYAVDGKYIAELDMVAFKISDAMELQIELEESF